MACAAEPLPCHPLPENETVTNRLTINKITWGSTTNGTDEDFYIEIDGQKVWGPVHANPSDAGAAAVNVSKTKSGLPGTTLARIQVRDQADSDDPVGPEILVATTTSTTGVTKTANISKWWRPIYLTYTVRQIS